MPELRSDNRLQLTLTMPLTYADRMRRRTLTTKSPPAREESADSSETDISTRPVFSMFGSHGLPENLAPRLARLFYRAIGRWWVNVPGPTIWPQFYEAKPSNDVWRRILNQMLDLRGGTYLAGGPRADPVSQCLSFLESTNWDEVLSLVEICCTSIDREVKNFKSHERVACGIEIDPDAALTETNRLLMDYGVNLQYVQGTLVPAESELMYVEAIEPAL